MTEEEINTTIEERIEFLSKHLKKLKTISRTETSSAIETILKDMINDDAVFRKKHKLYDDKLKNYIITKLDRLQEIESMGDLKRTQTKSSDIKSEIEEIKLHCSLLVRNLRYRTHPKSYFLDNQRD